MRFNQLKQVLAHFSESRCHLERLYQRLLGQADSERAKLLLSYLQQREAENCQHINDYIAQASSEVLETWVDFSVALNMSQLCEDVQLSPNMTCDEVLTAVLALDKQSLTELVSVRDELGMMGVQQYLDNLLEHQQQREQQLVRSVHRFDDL